MNTPVRMVIMVKTTHMPAMDHNLDSKVSCVFENGLELGLRLTIEVFYPLDLGGKQILPNKRKRTSAMWQ